MAPLDEALLDDAHGLAAADSSGVLRSLAGAGAQVRRAVELTEESVPARWDSSDRPRAVLVAARGGAAVVADALAAVMGAAGPVPVLPLTGATLPAWVGALDLVVALSLSGRAEGAVAVAAEAGRRGAALLTVGGTADSPLAMVSARFRGAHVRLPEPGREATSAPTSRTAMWSLLTPPLLISARLGLLPATHEDGVHGGLSAGEEELVALAAVLDAEAESCRASSEAFVNPAKSLALQLDDCVPVVLGDSPLAAVAARRVASVLARTARIPALHGGLPDDAGDVVATFGGPFAATGPEASDVFADPFLDGAARTRLRLLLLTTGDGIGVSVVRDIAERSAVRVSEVAGEQPTTLRSFAQVVARTDFAATYLALASGLDPARSPHVADLREALR